MIGVKQRANSRLSCRFGIISGVSVNASKLRDGVSLTPLILTPLIHLAQAGIFKPIMNQ
jgi:hypothetical protein